MFKPLLRTTVRDAECSCKNLVDPGSEPESEMLVCGTASLRQRLRPSECTFGEELLALSPPVSQRVNCLSGQAFAEAALDMWDSSSEASGDELEVAVDAAKSEMMRDFFSFLDDSEQSDCSEQEDESISSPRGRVHQMCFTQAQCCCCCRCCCCCCCCCCYCCWRCSCSCSCFLLLFLLFSTSSLLLVVVVLLLLLLSLLL
ncbi:unnamed protein product [Polarella glacialis]|uniref:Uncharacterized protein n=1 Tax=Polarella glacialis TaxID=89957 RepID=A0A813DDB9_POLGL|nr:unnamed protein product [Polarella glacialis]